MTNIACIIISTLGIQILTGYAGQVSIGHAAFFGTGAYTSAILMGELQFPFYIAFIGGGVAAGIVGLIAGGPSLRVKGFYLVMSTLATHYILFYVIHRWRSLTGGPIGYQFPEASLFGINLRSEISIYYIAIIGLLIATYAATNIVRTKMGRAFIAVRDNDLAANVMGINVWLVKLKAFFIGCFFAGIGGAIWGYWVGHLTVRLFSLMDAIWYLGYIIIGGLGSISGCFFGVTAVFLVREALSRVLPALDPSLAMIVGPSTEIIFGVVIIIMLVVEPRGLSHRWELFKVWYRVWPLARTLQ
jgi:branched-chain amino acid transport system permease protein